MILSALYRQAKEHLQNADIETAALDARLIIQHVLGLDQASFMVQQDLGVAVGKQAEIERLVSRRAAGEPVSKILGYKEFYGRDFKVTADTLDPRPETEILIEQALKWASGQRQPIHLIDLGTGTGCIPITLLKELPEATAVAVDISEAALKIAEENAKTHNVADRIQFVRSNWTSDINESFDLVVSNPPYIPESDIESLQKEVKNHDPILALEGGKDGLDPYRIIFSQLKTILKPDGAAFFEFGYAQGPNLERLIERAHFSLVGITPDIAGIPRVVEISIGEK